MSQSSTPPPIARRPTGNWLVLGSVWCFAMAMVLPVAKIGVDWPAGWQVFVMAMLGAPSIFIAPSDNYVLACFSASIGYVLLIVAWLVTLAKTVRRSADDVGHVRFGLAIGAGMTFGFALLPLVDAGLLRGVHLGLVFLLAAPMVLAIGIRKRSAIGPPQEPG